MKRKSLAEITYRLKSFQQRGLSVEHYQNYKTNHNGGALVRPKFRSKSGFTVLVRYDGFKFPNGPQRFDLCQGTSIALLGH